MPVLLMTVLLTIAADADHPLPSTLDYTTLRALPVQHDGRYPPLDTVARDIVESVTGDPAFEDQDAVAWLLAWTFEPKVWQRYPLISIRNAELRRVLQLPAERTTFSYIDLVRHKPLMQLFASLADIEQGQKLDPLQKKASDINDRLMQLQQVFGGLALRLVPHTDDIGGAWQSLGAAVPARAAVADEIRQQWREVRAAFLSDDSAAFDKAADLFAATLGHLPAAYRPPASKIEVELRYNRLHPYRLAWIAMAVGALLSALAMRVRRRWFDVLAVIGLLAGFALLSYGLQMRWQIAGRIPAANMFESLLFLSWGMGAFAIISLIVQRQRLVPLTASFMGALSLFLAEELPLDAYVRPIPPVLNDTIWMSIHVPIIMVSYSVLALAVLIAHVQLLYLAFGRRRENLCEKIDALHYWYVHVGSLLLLIGIVTGSMWAASSWGRYWGWDPKEVWSLVALLAYLAILHVRIEQAPRPRWSYGLIVLITAVVLVLLARLLAPLTSGKVLAFGGTALAVFIFVFAHGPFASAVKSIAAFWMIIMTYVGVNYVLGIGLHSYGFGTGAVATRMLTLGAADLAIVALCTLVYLLRNSKIKDVHHF